MSRTKYRQVSGGWVDPWGMPVRDPAILEVLNTPKPPRVRIHKPYVRKPPGPPKYQRGAGIRDAVGITRRLRAFCRKAVPGVPLTQKEIADGSGCSVDNVRDIEASALKKLRLRLPPSLLAEFRGFIA